MRRLMFLAVLSVGLAIPTAQAAPVVYSGFDLGANSTDPRPNSNAAQSSFFSAVGSTRTTVTFESSPLGAFSNLTIAPGVKMNGVDFFGANQTVRNTPFGTPDSIFGYNTTAGGSKFVNMTGGNLTFTFTDPVAAFGAFFTGFQGPSFGTGTVVFSDGTSQTLFLPNIGANGGSIYLGFTDFGKSISSITINAGSGGSGDFIAVDDVTFAPATVPEPVSMVVFGGLLAAGGLAVRRRMKVTA